MAKIPFFAAGNIGVIKDIEPEEIDPRAWTDGRGVRFFDDKAVRAYGDSLIFDPALAPPYWNMPVQSGSTAIWVYGNIGNGGNDAFTKILLHMDGPDAGTTFIDSNTGGSAHTWTAAGNAQIDTAQSKFGTASGLFDGTGDFVTTPDHADFTLGSSDWTIETWFNCTAAGGTVERIGGQCTSIEANLSWYIRRTTGNVIQAVVMEVGPSAKTITGTTQFTNAVNTGWHHVAFVRTGNTLKLFIDGVQEGGDLAMTGVAVDSPNAVGVGTQGEVIVDTWTGWLDEFRLSVGIARYTANFTPQLNVFGTSLEANLFATDGATHVNITRATAGLVVPYTMDRKKLWNGGTFSNIPVITNSFDVPQMWLAPSMSTRFADLSNWPSTDRCDVIKPFKSFLVALSITRSGTKYQHLVKWSHPAVPGSVPPSWDETNPTLQAGEVEILDELPGGIREGMGLRDTFMIYKDNATWGMQFIGGNSVFRFFPIFLNSGIMGAHCVASVLDGTAHFVATGKDFIIHDGQNVKSVFDKKFKNFILDMLPETLYDYCFCVEKPKQNEVWFCFPDGTVGESGELCNLAAIYNWKFNTTTLRAIPNGASHMDIGPIAASSDPWDADPLTWDSDTTAWDFALFSPHSLEFVASEPGIGNMNRIEDPTILSEGYIERIGLAVTGQDRVSGELKADNDMMKLVDRIWIQATGGPFNVQLGAQEFKESPLIYEPMQMFTPGVDKYLDFIPVNGRFLAIRVEWLPGGTRTKIAGYHLNLQPLGDQ